MFGDMVMNCEFCGVNYGIMELENGRLICGQCLYYGTGENENTFPGLIDIIEKFETQRED